MYRYGFQGQEIDSEIKGEGNSLNYKYRMHDPRVGRFFAVDPLSPQYPHYTPYSFSGNKLIAFRELEGLEEFQAITNRDWRWRYYIVQKGDNLSVISESTGVSIKTILGYNKDIVDQNLVYPNQLIDLNGGSELTVADFTFDTKQSNWAKDFVVELATSNDNGPSIQSSVETVINAAPVAAFGASVGLKGALGRGLLSTMTDLLVSGDSFNAMGVASDMLLHPMIGMVVGAAFEINISIKDPVEYKSVITGTKSLGEFGSDVGSSLLFGKRQTLFSKFAGDDELAKEVMNVANTYTSKAISEGTKNELKKVDE